VTRLAAHLGELRIVHVVLVACPIGPDSMIQELLRYATCSVGVGLYFKLLKWLQIIFLLLSLVAVRDGCVLFCSAACVTA
jgi:hypothetical protein